MVCNVIQIKSKSIFFSLHCFDIKIKFEKVFSSAKWRYILLVLRLQRTIQSNDKIFGVLELFLSSFCNTGCDNP